MTAPGRGILAVGCYLPRNRLPKTVAKAANSWFAPSLRARDGERRSFANWDEDALTMAVEAGRACLADADTASVSRVDVASTSMPFADRSNAGVVREALDVPATAAVANTGGSLFNFSAGTAAPEPGTLALLGLGAVGLLARRRRG